MPLATLVLESHHLGASWFVHLLPYLPYLTCIPDTDFVSSQIVSERLSGLDCKEAGFASVFVYTDMYTTLTSDFVLDCILKTRLLTDRVASVIY
jgi:hypothetical protein